MSRQFTEEEIKVYELFGFKMDPNKHSGFPYKEIEDSSYNEYDVLIALEDGYKIESYGTYPNGDDGWEDSYHKTFSEKGETLSVFLLSEFI